MNELIMLTPMAGHGRSYGPGDTMAPGSQEEGERLVAAGFAKWRDPPPPPKADEVQPNDGNAAATQADEALTAAAKTKSRSRGAAK